MESDPDFHAAAARLDCRVIQVERLTGGSSAQVWRLDLRDRNDQASSVVLRRHRPMDSKARPSTVAVTEHEILRFLHQHNLPVAEPLLVDRSNNWLITSFVNGSADVAADQIEPMLVQIADFLIRLHRVPIASLAATGLDELEDPLGALLNYLPDSNAGRLLGSLLARGDIELHPNSAVLIHGDYWPGNVLWEHGRLTAVIDWEDSCLGDPLADLACTRVELLCRYGDEAMVRFTDEYMASNSELDLRSLPVWEAYVSAAAMATMHSWAWSQPTAEVRQRGITTAFFERAARALSTDKLRGT